MSFIRGSHNTNPSHQCARCLDHSPMVYDSGYQPIKFCPKCGRELEQWVIVEGIRHHVKDTFRVEVLMWHHHQVVRYTGMPWSGQLVHSTAFLQSKTALPYTLIRSHPTHWGYSLFLEAVYALEWQKNHLLESLKQISMLSLY